MNINISVCAMTRATFDKPTAVNYELACRAGDRLVNMQSWRSAPSPRNTSVRPLLHPEWQGLTWVSITCTGQATGRRMLGMDPKTTVWKLTLFAGITRRKLDEHVEPRGVGLV